MKLVISEKPSAAKSYAEALGVKSKKEGYYEGNGYIISWCIGHLLGLAEPSAYDEKYTKWRKQDLPISPITWQYKPTPSTKKQLKTLVDLIKRPDVKTIINGADAGREGELIFRLVYEHAKSKKPVQRLWVSSMEESALKEGFNKLQNGSEYDNLYQAAKCRQQADWLVGMNYSRLFSVVYNATLRVGRVQTPTLAMVVERLDKINNFVKEAFYIVELEGAGFIASGEKLTDKTKAYEISDKCNGKPAVIKSIKKQDKSITSPKLYDLTTLQREANKTFGYTASKTLELVQSLYEKKLATYPRTDSKFITEDMAHSIPNLVSGMAEVLNLSHLIKAKEINTKAIVNNKKVTDHHAIIPTPTATNTNIQSLPSDEANILKMLAVKLLCATAEKHSYAETTVTVNCQEETFTARGKTVTNNGFKAIEEAFSASISKKPKDNATSKLSGKSDNKVSGKADGKETDKALPPNITEGQEYTAQTQVREGFTSPPKHYTEDTLLSSMENAGAEGVTEDIERKGLGTPATRAGIIENLIKSDFLKREKKNLLPTQKGINLIKILPDKVKSPLLTADWENNLKRMERGEVSANNFMQDINTSVADTIKTYGEAPAENKGLFDSENNTANSKSGKNKYDGEVIGRCPRCGGNVSESPKAFSCEHTRNKSCGFTLWKDNKWFASQGKNITKAIAAALVKDGKVFIKDLKSQKSGKTYSATVVLDDNKDGYTNFKLDFEKK